MSSYDLAVAYRIYPGVSKSPPIHADNKERLAELCLYSFRQALGDVKAKLYVLLDGCDHYRPLFQRHFPHKDLEFLSLPKVGNQATFSLQIDTLLKQKDSEAVLLMEDDYCFLPNTIAPMLEFLKHHQDADFVSPYDHRDFHTLKLHQNKGESRSHSGVKWNTRLANTCTFLTHKQTLKETRKVFSTYPWLGDLGIFTALTTSLPQVLQIMTRLHGTPEAWLNRQLWNTLKSHGGKIAFKKRYKLWTPTPSFATHMDAPFLSPGINWEQVFEATQRKTTPYPQRKNHAPIHTPSAPDQHHPSPGPSAF